jgi:guanylate kinase
MLRCTDDVGVATPKCEPWREKQVGSVGPKKILNISGPYAAGKDTLLNAIISRYPNLTHRVNTVTTRPASPGADPTYRTVSLAEMQQLALSDQLIVTSQFGATVLYGTSANEIREKISEGKICVHAIFAGADGAGRLREVFGAQLFSIGVLATHGDIDDQMKVLAARLAGRTRDNEEAVKARLAYQTDPISYVLENPVVKTGDGDMLVFDRVIVNDNLERAVAEVLALFTEFFEVREG